MISYFPRPTGLAFALPETTLLSNTRECLSSFFVRPRSNHGKISMTCLYLAFILLWGSDIFDLVWLQELAKSYCVFVFSTVVNLLSIVQPSVKSLIRYHITNFTFLGAEIPFTCKMPALTLLLRCFSFIVMLSRPESQWWSVYFEMPHEYAENLLTKYFSCIRDFGLSWRGMSKRTAF